MDKLEKLLQDTLQKVGGEFHPSDPVAARERFLASRRRRRLYAFAEAGAAVGMAALAVIFIARANIGSETKFETASEQPRVVATIDTSANPVAVAVGEGAVWMTDSEGGGIKKIDPTTNEEIASIPMSEEPDEVIVGLGYVWVSDTSGGISKIDPSSGDVLFTEDLFEGTSVEHSTSVRLDLTILQDALWAVDPSSGSIHQIATASEYLGSSHTSYPGLTDVASDGSMMWGLLPEKGVILRLDGSLGEFSVPVGDENSDLAVGFDAAWIATGADGKVYRVDLESGEHLETEIGGSYADLSIDITEEAVWALAIDDEAGTSEVFELDPVTAEIVSEPIQLPGVASDMSVGEGSVWVPDEDGQVRRISSEVVSPPAPDESAEAVTELPDDRLLYVFVRDDDLYAQYVGGEEQLTDTPELESAPTVGPDGRYVAFVSRPYADGRQDIYELDLENGGAPLRVADNVTEPSYGPTGELAWIVPPGGTLPSNRATALMPWLSFRIGDRDPQSVELFENWQEGLQVSELTWDQAGTQLYIDTRYEGTTVQTIDVEIDNRGIVTVGHAEVIPVIRDDTLFVAPAFGPTLNVIQTCCSTIDGVLPDESVLAEIRLDDYAVEEIADLSALDLDETLDLQLASMGTLWVEDGEWLLGTTASWLIGDGLSLWLVDANGSHVQLDAASEFAAPVSTP